MQTALLSTVLIGCGIVFIVAIGITMWLRRAFGRPMMPEPGVLIGLLLGAFTFIAVGVVLIVIGGPVVVEPRYP